LSAGAVHAKEISAPVEVTPPADTVRLPGADGTADDDTTEMLNVLESVRPAELVAVIATDLVAPPDTFSTLWANSDVPIMAKSAALVPPDTANE
jgi:hypothetical protein